MKKDSNVVAAESAAEKRYKKLGCPDSNSNGPDSPGDKNYMTRISTRILMWADRQWEKLSDAFMISLLIKVSVTNS